MLRDIETLRDAGHRQGIGLPMGDWSEAQERAHSALTQLRIIAPKLETPALALWQASQRILAAAQLRTYAAGQGIPPEAHDWEQLDKGYDDAHAAFLAAAKRHVG